MPLDREQLEHYWDRGFLLLESLIDTGSLARWSQRFEDIVLGRIPTPEHLTVMKDVMVVQGATQPASPLHAVAKILSFENDPVLWEYPTEARLLDAVRSIIGRELRSISSNVFNKPPGVDGRFPLHQDLRYFTLRPAGKIVATWTAITQTTRDNGCLAVVPGSHHHGLREHLDPDWEHVNRGYFAAAGVDPEERVHIEMAPGDTLLFHPLLLHGSGSNRTSGFRRAISTHFASSECVRPEGPRKRRAVIKDVE
jgi:phytanoyl-CoA hydroxylase